ncbi:DapH/DapD/GlmU-related protein [Janthinobacterium lividum]|uniref:DapH/DapD/GlmU-related protein n=1 Tax=Janthinobacterium lividum TaxID=29581 RepID=UPI00140BB2DD|nr:DapH/DapD/GlmU-related protein [Janthinobacterium lividum]NHQ89642.1 acyltransferase [Janthinobacterium lividum]
MSDSIQLIPTAKGKLARRIKQFKSEPLSWALYMLGAWGFAKLRSAMYARLLKAPGLNVGPRCAIRGTQCITMGSGVSIYGGLWLEAVQHYRQQSFSPTIIIGDNVSFSLDVHITCVERIEIGNGVLFGSRVHVSDHNHGSYVGTHQSHPQQAPAERELALRGAVIIEDNVWIGDNVIILGPVRIGAGAIVGANSVISTDVPAATMVVGAPAKVVKQFDYELNLWKKI